MYKVRKEDVPRYDRDGTKSHLLVAANTGNVKNMYFTQVEMKIGGIQKPHSHLPEQIYFILKGEGLMSVGKEKEMVINGDCIFIPSGEEHGLENVGKTPLSYISASSPSLSEEEFRRGWPLSKINIVQ